MQIENHKEEVPFAHYEELFYNLNPEQTDWDQKGVKWDGKEFYVNLLGREFAITHPDYAIRATDGGAVPALTVQTFLLRYLIQTKAIPWLGQWKTFREMPWGEMYIKPFTGRALTRAAFTFGTCLEGFRNACRKMGGISINHADAAFQFDFLGSYKMQILIWEGDEEFPPNAQILYSDNFSEGFAAEDRVVAADILIAAIKSNM